MEEESNAESCENCNCDQYFLRMAVSAEIMAGQRELVPTPEPTPLPEPEPQPEPEPELTFIVDETLYNPEQAKLLPTNNVVGAKLMPDGTPIYIYIKNVLQVIRHYPHYWEVKILKSWRQKFVGQVGFVHKGSARLIDNPDVWDWN